MFSGLIKNVPSADDSKNAHKRSVSSNDISVINQSSKYGVEEEEFQLDENHPNESQKNNDFSPRIQSAEFTNDEKEFIMKMEAKVRKEKEQINASSSIRKQLSKYSQIVLGDKYTEEEKEKMGLVSSEFRNPNLPSKDSNQADGINSPDKKNVASIFLKKKNDQQYNVFKWRGKSRKKTEFEEKMITTEYDIGKEEECPQVKKKNLHNFLQKQFNMSRITLPNPDRLENYREERFVRDKSQLARTAEYLNREIKHEKVIDKSKLASSIFADIEKQESWQSYTTLLFTNAEVNTAKTDMHK